jgi:YHS domain-containing protein
LERVLAAVHRENTMLRRAILLQGLALSAVLAVPALAPALAQERPLVLKGYDPVAYFTDGKPTQGSAEYEMVFDGQRYRFASAQHRDLFKTNPDKYAPQFSGLCAMNLSRGVKRESDPHNWVISNGNLYVYASETGQQNFTKDPSTVAAKANANWKSLKTSVTQ